MASRVFVRRASTREPIGCASFTLPRPFRGIARRIRSAACARVPHRLRRAAAKLTSYRVIPFDPVLRDRAEEPERREAWLRDQYLHPEEHCHSVAEVQTWFRDNDVEFLRTYPTTLLGALPLDPEELFTAAEDDWWFENIVSQIGWSTTLGREGGLFIAVGRSAGPSRSS